MELDSLFETYKNSVFQKDAAFFASIFAEDVYVFDLWQWTFEGVVAWRQMAEGWFDWLGKERCVVEFSEVRTEVAGEMGYASAMVKYKGVDENGAELRSLVNRLTWVAMRTDGVWKIVHEHTSGPVDKETMKVLLER